MQYSCNIGKSLWIFLRYKFYLLFSLFCLLYFLSINKNLKHDYSGKIQLLFVNKNFEMDKFCYVYHLGGQIVQVIQFLIQVWMKF